MQITNLSFFFRNMCNNLAICSFWLWDFQYVICSDRINDFYQKFISTLLYYVFRRKLLSTTPQKGEGEKKFCVRILCKKTTFGKYQNTFSPTHYNQRSDERRRGFGGYFMRLLWLFLVISNQKWCYLTTQFCE